MTVIFQLNLRNTRKRTDTTKTYHSAHQSIWWSRPHLPAKSAKHTKTHLHKHSTHQNWRRKWSLPSSWIWKTHENASQNKQLIAHTNLVKWSSSSSWICKTHKSAPNTNKAHTNLGLSATYDMTSSLSLFLASFCLVLIWYYIFFSISSSGVFISLCSVLQSHHTEEMTPPPSLSSTPCLSFCVWPSLKSISIQFLPLHSTMLSLACVQPRARFWRWAKSENQREKKPFAKTFHAERESKSSQEMTHTHTHKHTLAAEPE